MDSAYARLDERVSALERDVAALENELGGMTTRSDGLPVRARLHKLEGILAAQEYARELLDKASERLEEARHTRDQRFVWIVGGGVTLGNLLLAAYTALH